MGLHKNSIVHLPENLNIIILNVFCKILIYKINELQLIFERNFLLNYFVNSFEKVSSYNFLTTS